MKVTRFYVTRDVTPDECDWLPETVPTGSVVQEYTGATYGAITDAGVACSWDGNTPFFELPWDALEVIPVSVLDDDV
jgi:hypothetical protein